MTALLPFQLEFMQRAFAITVIVAAPMALLSCYLVLRGWSLMGDAISHAVLPGIVLAYRMSIPLAVGAFAAGMLCAVATGFLKENSRIKEATVMGVVFSGMFGLGVVLYVQTVTDIHLDHILFGDPLGVTWRDVGASGLIAGFAAVAVLARWRDLLACSFDEQHARAIGLPVRVLHYGLLALVSLMVVAALKAVGIILAIALLIGPGAVAFLWARSFGAMLAIATIAALVAAVSGVYASFWLDSAPGPTIVLAMTAIFAVSVVATRSRDAGRRPVPATAESAARASGPGE
jgi:manganese/iron transport system permease protein